MQGYCRDQNEMKIIFTSLFFIMCTINIVLPQDTIYILHPVIGEQIDIKAKKDYLLFPEIKDSCFNFCFIKQINGKYYVSTYFNNDSVSNEEVALPTLENYHNNIEKLYQYYSSKSKQDSLNNNETINLHKNNNSIKTEMFKKEIVSPTLNPEIRDEVRRDQRLKSDAERMKYYKQGTEIMPGNIEIYNSKNIKKKK
jgi:hypothetical protein